MLGLEHPGTDDRAVKDVQHYRVFSNMIYMPFKSIMSAYIFNMGGRHVPIYSSLLLLLLR